MIEKILNIKDEVRIPFKQHFLKGVILDVTFDKNIKKYFENSAFRDFFTSKNFDNCTEIKNANFTITMDNDEPIAQQTNSTIGYAYINSENNNQIQIINNRFVFVHNSYDKFENLEQEIQIFNENVFSKMDTTISKIGYRKINSIIAREITSYNEITELFNENLFNFLKCNLFDFRDLENYRDNFTLSKNNSKIIINTTCNKIKNIENSYEITVDTDIIQLNNVHFENITTIVSEMNQLHFNTFCWVTSDKMKNIMNGKI